MICKGTRIEETQPDDEQHLERDLSEQIERADGLLLVGFAWEDLDRYETVTQAAHAAGRTPVFNPRMAYLKARHGHSVHEEDASVFVERSDSMLYSPGDYTRAKHKAGEIPIDEWSSKDGVKDTSHLAKGHPAAHINEAPHKYVPQMDYYRFLNLLDFDIPDCSVFIRAQTELFDEEMKLSEERLINRLIRFSLKRNQGHQSIQLHASGHAAGVEIFEMIAKIEPEILVPVQTESPGAFENPAGTIREPSLAERSTFHRMSYQKQ